jgi:hypothetical protein
MVRELGLMDTLPASMETSYASPHRAIKAEEDCLSDIYNVSDRGYVKKTFSTIPRDRSKSIAQLSTPMASRPTSIAGDQELIAEDFFVKNESDESCIGERKALHNRSTPPASSPERCASSIQRQKPAPFILKQNPKKISPSPTISHKNVGNSIFVDESPTDARKWTSKEGDKTTSVDLEPKLGGLWRPTVRNRIQQPATSATSPERMLRPEPPPVLPPVKIRKPSGQTSTASVHIAFRLAKISTPDRPITIRENARIHTPGSLGTREDLSSLRNPKSVSLCPNFASSFGPDDDIPPSEKMRQEAAKAITDSTNKFMAKRLSRVSPSLRNRQLSSSIQDDPSASANDDSRDIYTDYGRDFHLQLTPEQLDLLQKFEQDTRNSEKFIETQQDFVSLGKRVMDIEKKMLQSSSRPLPLLSRVPGMFKALHDDNERNRLEYLEFSEDEETSDGSESHYTSRSIAGFHKSGRPMVPGQDRGMKRGRTESVNWHPGLFVDNDVPSDEEIVEIGKEDFEKSERNKPKRQKVIGDEIGKASDAISREPEEAVDAEQDLLYEEVKERLAATVTNNEIGSK